MTISSLDRRVVSLHPSAAQQSACVPVEEFVASMRKLASGVAVITTFVDGSPWGLTLSSVSSFSAEPARISLSITKSNKTAAYIKANERFGVAILPHAKASLAATLSASGQPKFIPGADLAAAPGPILGMPAIDGALFNLECSVAFHVEALDHVLIVADVVSTNAGDGCDNGAPLTYFDREFCFIPKVSASGSQRTTGDRA